MRKEVFERGSAGVVEPSAPGEGPKYSVEASDEDVVNRVQNALHWDLAVPRDCVKVRCDNGWVVLTGIVEHAYQKSAAEADVRRIREIVGVSNKIVVAAPAAPH